MCSALSKTIVPLEPMPSPHTQIPLFPPLRCALWSPLSLSLRTCARGGWRRPARLARFPSGRLRKCPCARIQAIRTSFIDNKGVTTSAQLWICGLDSANLDDVDAMFVYSTTSCMRKDKRHDSIVCMQRMASTSTSMQEVGCANVDIDATLKLTLHV